tara:strand:+ start:817 stop:1140 length:324 start_codon:yes stop_codon:yes gene_type:complete
MGENKEKETKTEYHKRYNKMYNEDNKEKKKEYNKRYNEKRKEYLIEYRKAYYKENRDILLEKNKAYHENKKQQTTCECGCVVTKNHISRHKKSQKHAKLLIEISENN